MLCQITGRPERLEISSNNFTLSRIGTDTPSEPREICTDALIDLAQGAGHLDNLFVGGEPALDRRAVGVHMHRDSDWSRSPRRRRARWL